MGEYNIMKDKSAKWECEGGMSRVTKSDQIRALYDEGWKVAEISQLLGIRYQFAYNVVSYYIAQKARREVAAYAISTGTSDVRSIHG